MSAIVRTGLGDTRVPTLEEHDLWAAHLLVCFLQGLFNKIPREERFHWEPDIQTTGIFIAEGTPIDYGRVSPRPAIAVDVGPYQAANLAMDQLRAGNLMTGERLHMDLVPGSTTVYVVAKLATEARRICGWVMRQIRYHHRVLQKVGGFHSIGDQLSVSPPLPPGNVVMGHPDSEAVMSALLVPWHMQWGWYVRPVAPEQQTTLEYILGERADSYERPPMQRMKNLRASFEVDDETLQESGLEPGPTTPDE